LVFHEPLSGGVLLGSSVAMAGLAIAVFGRRPFALSISSKQKN
jgi:hypothetical protein